MDVYNIGYLEVQGHTKQMLQLWLCEISLTKLILVFYSLINTDDSKLKIESARTKLQTGH